MFIIKDGVLEQYDGSDEVVVIPEGVTRIAEKAFEENETITEVIMPDTVTSIESYAFKKCGNLKKVAFSPALETIEYGCFEECRALKAAHLPKTLRYLGYHAFEDCGSLNSVTCEAEDLILDCDPFVGTPVHSKLTDEQGFSIFCGVLFAYSGTATALTIPDGVKTVNAYVFQSGEWHWEKQYDLESVVVPDSVREIGDKAFANNRKLKSVRLPHGVKLGSGVFENCPGLADANGFFLYDGVACAYYGDREHVTVAEGVKELAENLFYENKLHSVSLPDSLERIGESAFRGCGLLKAVAIPERVREIGSSAFRDCSRLAEISIPDSVETIGECAFFGCKALADKDGFVIVGSVLHGWFGTKRAIVVPEGITEITHHVFEKSAIESIRLPSTLQKLGSAFTGCNRLTGIEIPEGVTKLFEYTFRGCKSLQNVSLPDTLTELDDQVFEGCEALTEIRIPDGVSAIGQSAFQNCKSLRRIRIPEGITEIQWETFDGCESLTEVHLPESLRVIGSYAFEDCTSLKEITLPDAIGKIRYHAFGNCKRLQIVRCGTLHGTIEPQAFDGCAALFDESGLMIVGDVLLQCAEGVKNAVVPEGVTTVAPGVFLEGNWKYGWHCGEGTLETVVLPTTLKRIGSCAFAGCVKLKQITLPSGVEEIGPECFSNCTALREIALPASVTVLRSGTFLECKALKQIALPAALRSIERDALRDCRALKTVAVEDGSESFSVIDGILFNKEGDTLLLAPGGRKLTEYTVPARVKTIGRRAFADCTALRKIVIPATVENVGDEAFMTDQWYGTRLTKIEVSPGAGSGSIGKSIFNFGYEDVLVYPKLPVTFVSELREQVRLCLGYCLHPEQYGEEYAEPYRQFAQSHQRTLVKRAKQLRLDAVERYFEPAAGDNKKQKDGGYKPDLSMKRPSELIKVEILEEAVLKGTLEDLKAVLQTYKPFEMTARALGLAARYRGVAFVDALIQSGATFQYEHSGSMQRKYTPFYQTAGGTYSTEYYLMAAPERYRFHKGECEEFPYSPMCGVPYTGITQELEEHALPLNERLEVVKYLSEKKVPGVSLDEMLFWALTRGEFAFADALIGMGVNLRKTPPSYYSHFWGDPAPYMDVITTYEATLFRNSYVWAMTQLKQEQLLPSLERLHALAAAAGKTLAVSQKMLDECKWNDASLSFVLKNADCSKFNQKTALERAVSGNCISALSAMADAGWLRQKARRDALIAFAREGKKTEALAWLMDYVHRTVDTAAELEKEEKKAMRALSERPDSVSALSRIWGYKKRDDGTLAITSYKGSATEVEIPAKIGKNTVTAIGAEAFTTTSWRRIDNIDVRKHITSVTVPEGVTEIGDDAFYRCSSLKTVKLPGTLKKIGKRAFFSCKKLKTVDAPKRIPSIGEDAFYDCAALKDKGGFIILNGTLCEYSGKNASPRIPDGVKTIGKRTFAERRLETVEFPEGLEAIEEGAFEESTVKALRIPGSVKKIGKRAFAESELEILELSEGLETIGEKAFEETLLKTVRIPNSVKKIEAGAFYGCDEIMDFFISDQTVKFGERILGPYGAGDDWSSRAPSGVYVHTPAGSAAEKYMERYDGVAVVHDDAD